MGRLAIEIGSNSIAEGWLVHENGERIALLLGCILIVIIIMLADVGITLWHNQK